MTPASSREFGTVSEITLRPRKEAAVRPIEKAKETMEEQIERVSRENKEKDRTSSGGSPAREIPKPELSEAEKKAKKAAYMREYWKTYKGTKGPKKKGPPGKPSVAALQKKLNAKPKTRSLDAFKEKLAAAKEVGKARKKKAGKAPKARKGIRDMGTKGRKTWAELSPAQRKRKLKYQREYHKLKKARLMEAALGTPPTNGHAKGTFPPYPFRFCPDCAHPLPTVERNGKVLPAAKPFCGDCGYKIPLMKG